MKYLRLKKRKEFGKIMKTGKRVYAGSLTIVYLPSRSLKMAVCVGKKYGKSVQRNRIKRLLREAFRAQSAVGCYSFLLIPKLAETYSYAGFKRDMERILRREKLFVPVAEDDRGEKHPPAAQDGV